MATQTISNAEERQFSPQRTPWYQRSNLRRVVREITSHGLLLPVSLVMMFPLLWLFSTSLKTRADVFEYPPSIIPDPIQWSNYSEALTVLPFDLFFRNTMIIVVARLIGQIITCTMAGYAFARLKFPGRDILFWLVLIKMMLPAAVTMVPEYVMFSRLGWINTFLPLTVPAFLPGWFSSSFYIFLCRQFFRGLPVELDDAAKIDGASHFRIWWQIVLPLSKPVIATVAVFSFMTGWNDFQGPLIYISKLQLRPLALGLISFRGSYSTDWHWMMAASATMVIPVIILFFLAQNYFLRGISMTGIAGR